MAKDLFGNDVTYDDEGNSYTHSTDLFGNKVTYDQKGNTYTDDTDIFGNRVTRSSDGKEYTHHDDIFGNHMTYGSDGSVYRTDTDIFGNTVTHQEREPYGSGSSYYSGASGSAYSDPGSSGEYLRPLSSADIQYLNMRRRDREYAAKTKARQECIKSSKILGFVMWIPIALAVYAFAVYPRVWAGNTSRLALLSTGWLFGLTFGFLLVSALTEAHFLGATVPAWFSALCEANLIVYLTLFEYLMYRMGAYRLQYPDESLFTVGSVFIQIVSAVHMIFETCWIDTGPSGNFMDGKRKKFISKWFVWIVVLLHFGLYAFDFLEHFHIVAVQNYRFLSFFQPENFVYFMFVMMIVFTVCGFAEQKQLKEYKVTA